MKQKDIALIILVATVTAFASFVIAKNIFKPPVGSTEVPVVTAIDPNFPDVKNDSQYNTIFNNQALDPTQPVQIGNPNNVNPFQ
jgi:hypothetical protein